VPRTRPGLSRDAVLGAALAIIDESGIEACTMRAVAAELGVEAMSLYWHLPSKEALLDGVVEMVLREVQAEHEPSEDWAVVFTSFGHSFRRVVLRHPNVVHLLADRPIGAYVAAGPMAEHGLASLERAGFPRGCAIRAVRTLSRFVVGSTLLEVGTATAPPALRDGPALSDLLDAVTLDDPAELFDYGLQALIAGIEAVKEQHCTAQDPDPGAATA
jgi:AcrR family transcriptional regulator